MSKVRIYVEGHYEVQNGPFAKDYIWQPGHALIECDCGKVIDADEHRASCPNCGTDHAGLVRDVGGGRLSEEVLHPWHPDYESWVAHRKREGHASEFDELE